MYTTYLAGGIASGKSTVARLWESWGARRVDLDQASRDVLAPGQPCVRVVAQAFGQDLVNPATGELSRAALAARAFATAEGTARLEAIELPFIGEELERRLGEARADGVACCVVEVPLLDRMGALLNLADEVVTVVCPLETRRLRAQGRGMDPVDFDARAARQPTEAYLRAHATTVIENAGDELALADKARAWWDARAAAGWASAKRGEETR